MTAGRQKFVTYTQEQLRHLKGRSNFKRVDAFTDEELHANALSDPDNPPLTDAELKSMRRVVPRGNGFYGPPKRRTKA